MTPDMRREELRAARAIARAVADDIALAIRQHVEDAQARGQPWQSTFSRTFKRALAAKGWWGRRDQIDPKTGLPLDTPEKIPHRLKLVIQTNTRTARAAGEWTAIQRKKTDLPLLVYRHGDPERDRPEHVQYWAKPIVLPVDHEFWRVAFAPNGYGCTCHIEQVATGEVTPQEQVPARITIKGKPSYPGIPYEFAYNPGIDRLEGLRRAQILRRDPK